MSILTIENFKKAYNFNLKRFKKAEKYFETCSEDESEKWLPELVSVIDAMGTVLEALDRRGVHATSEEIENGFKEEDI